MKWFLERWFRDIEARVWGYVTAYYGNLRPKRIFLVTGQTLTTEYWISHQETASVGCEVSIRGGIGVPNVIEGHIYWGEDIGNVRASLGFEIYARRKEDRPEQLHSIFFETVSSAPTIRFRRLKQNSPRSCEIESIHRYSDNGVGKLILCSDTFFKNNKIETAISRLPTIRNMVTI